LSSKYPTKFNLLDFIDKNQLFKECISLNAGVLNPKFEKKESYV